MTQLDCKNLYDQGIDNIADELYQHYLDRSIYSHDDEKEEIKLGFKNRFTKLCIIEPIAVKIHGEEMWRVSHLVEKGILETEVEHYDLNNIKRMNVDVYMDIKQEYHIITKNIQADHTHTCPPNIYDIARSMCYYVYGSVMGDGRTFEACAKTIERKTLQ